MPGECAREGWMDQKPDGRLRPELEALAPAGIGRMSANPHANGGILALSLEQRAAPGLLRSGRAERVW